jgi:antitoxin HicB
MTPLTHYAHAHEAEPGAWLVQFFDVPEAIAQGDSFEEAKGQAADALDAALEGYLELGRDLPARADVDPASAARGHFIFEVPIDPALSARGLLAAKLRADGLSQRALAKIMNRDEKVVRRILSPHGASLDLVLDALRAVGVRAALAA